VPYGTTFKLGCESDTGSRIRWTFNRARFRRPFIIYNGYKIHSIVTGRITAHATEARNDLTITRVGPNDSGEYTCHELKTAKSVKFYVTVNGT